MRGNRRKRALDLVAREPANPQYQRDAFNEQLMLCQTLLTAGFGSEPMKIMPAIVDARRKVWKNDPSNYLALRDIATALRVYGDALHTTGRVREGIAAQTESLALHDELVKLDPKDTFIFNQIANVERSLASMLLDAGELDRARTREPRGDDSSESLEAVAGELEARAGRSIARAERARQGGRATRRRGQGVRDRGRKAFAGPGRPSRVRLHLWRLLRREGHEAQRRRNEARGGHSENRRARSHDRVVELLRMHLRRADAEKAQADALATQAEKSMRDAIVLDPATFFFRQTLAQALTVRAEIARANNDSTTARSRFNEALDELTTLQQLRRICPARRGRSRRSKHNFNQSDRLRPLQFFIPKSRNARRRGMISLRAAIVLAVIGFVGVCIWTWQATRPARPDGKTQIVVWNLGLMGSGIDLALHDFEQRFPDYRVVHSASVAPNTTADGQRLLCTIAGGVPPDLILFDRFAIAEWAVRGALTPLEPLLAKQAPSDPYRIALDEYYPWTLEEGSYRKPGSADRSALFGVPVTVDCRLLFSNTDQLRQAGMIDPATGQPRPPRTWKSCANSPRV